MKFALFFVYLRSSAKLKAGSKKRKRCKNFLQFPPCFRSIVH